MNRVLEQARTGKEIGSSLEAKLLLFVADSQFRTVLQALNPADSLSGNRVDELRYLFITSQVKLLESANQLTGSTYATKSEALEIGVVDAEGEKCDRCWNYSTRVGESKDHPLLCERCVPAIEGQF